MSKYIGRELAFYKITQLRVEHKANYSLAFY